MRQITVKMKDGSQKIFEHKGRAGGSYTIKAQYENGFVKIHDEWGKIVSIPSQDILEVIEEPFYR